MPPTLLPPLAAPRLAAPRLGARSVVLSLVPAMPFLLPSRLAARPAAPRHDRAPAPALAAVLDAAALAVGALLLVGSVLLALTPGVLTAQVPTNTYARPAAASLPSVGTTPAGRVAGPAIGPVAGPTTLPTTGAGSGGSGAVIQLTGGQTVADKQVQKFLTGAATGINESEVVSKACANKAAVAKYGATLTQLASQMGQLKGLAAKYKGKGMLTADLAVASASNGFAKASELGAKADRYAATFGMAALCNTSETANLLGRQYDFLRLVVNRGTTLSLPNMVAALNTAGQATTPVALAERRARMDRLFVRVKRGSGVTFTSTADDAETTAIRAAYETADRAEAAAQAQQQANTRAYQEFVNSPPLRGADGKLYCLDTDAAGKVTQRQVASGTGCGIASVGRSRQYTAAQLGSANNSLAAISVLKAQQVKLTAINEQSKKMKEALRDANAVRASAW